MEILQSDDKLREEILNDAKTKAERLLKRSDVEIKDMEEKMKKDLERFEEETRIGVERFIEEEKVKIFASIDIDFKKKRLKIIGDFIEEIFEKLKTNILNNKEIYKKIIQKLLIKAFEMLNCNSYEIVIDKKESEYLGKDFFIEINRIVDFTLIEKQRQDGIIVYDSEKKRQVFISIDKFIENFKSKERYNIYTFIFKEGN